MSDKRETRDVEIDSVEIREDGRAMIAGHAAVFDKLSEDLGGFREKIAPGAFQRSIDKAPKRDIYALWQHQSDKPLGRAGNGTLRLIEDKRGLAVEIDPPATRPFSTSSARISAASARRSRRARFSARLTRPRRPTSMRCGSTSRTSRSGAPATGRSASSKTSAVWRSRSTRQPRAGAPTPWPA